MATLSIQIFGLSKGLESLDSRSNIALKKALDRIHIGPTASGPNHSSSAMMRALPEISLMIMINI